MQSLIDFGYGLLDMASVVGGWLLTPLTDIGIPLVEVLERTGLPINATVADFILGSGITFVLGYKMIKFITDIVL